MGRLLRVKSGHEELKLSEKQVRRASVSDMKRLRELEEENAKLKGMYADLALENAAIMDVLNRKL